jgi:hypothetical protein
VIKIECTVGFYTWIRKEVTGATINELKVSNHEWTPANFRGIAVGGREELMVLFFSHYGIYLLKERSGYAWILVDKGREGRWEGEGEGIGSRVGNGSELENDSEKGPGIGVWNCTEYGEVVLRAEMGRYLSWSEVRWGSEGNRAGRDDSQTWDLLPCSRTED